MSTTEGSSSEIFVFWDRQYQVPSTVAQRWFDVLFGIIAPFLCLYFDPIVFRDGWTGGNGFFSDFRPFAYLEIAASTLVLGFYLLTQRPSALLAGALRASGFFAVTLGVVMLPLTLVGLFAGIGIFGFTPFVTGWVFLRNARRCWASSSAEVSRKARLLLAAVGMVLMLAIPAGLQASTQYLAKNAVETIVSGPEQDFSWAIRTLRVTRFLVSPDPIAFAYQRSTEQTERDRLARAFQSITGQSVDKRLLQLND